MTDPAIRVDGIGKRYRLGEHHSFGSLRESVMNRLSSFGRKRPTDESSSIWALRDVSFAVAQGEAVGIIGRNGAGKSTLLKVLSRITEPTEGRAVIRGRVGSLLEVGTGFHPELTGRENIFLNGAILGMSREETRRQFDDIVAFAEGEDFLDTPVKRYSSGMYLRLAFAVAAHLEPEILLVDEVLAVGDAAFQKRCIGKMSEVTEGGRTVLFVSHNMAAIQRLCGHALWIDEGRLAATGPADDIIARYLKTSVEEIPTRAWDDPATAPGNDKVRIHRVSVRPRIEHANEPISMRTPLDLEFDYWNLQPDALLNLSIHLVNAYGVTVFNTTTSTDQNWHGRPFPTGLFRSTCRIPGLLLNEGSYRVVLLVVENEGVVIHRMDDVVSFEVQDSPELRGNWYGRWEGVIHPQLSWNTELMDGGLDSNGGEA